MQRLVVLLTNFDLARRGGTQLYLRDVALGLLARGHTPIAYAPRLGEVARELVAAGVLVTDDLSAVATPPDVIHAHHNHELFTALLQCPHAPALRICHGWLDERPQPSPRVLRYVAVDDTTRDRCLYEWGVPADRLEVLLNFVDLERFRPRGPLPSRPARALVFSHNAREHLWAIRAACEPHGIAVESMGDSAGTASAAPGERLGDYDLVFAKGRAALEAMASGTAVVLCDRAGAGPLVTSTDLPRLRRLNFGIRTLSRALSADAIAAEIARYDPDDAAAVTRTVRATAGADAAIDALVAGYREVLTEHRASVRDVEGDLPAAAAYLHALSPRVRWAGTPTATRQLLLRSMYLKMANLPGLRTALHTRWGRRAVLAARDWRRRLRVAD
jgi:hypothetical protein